MGDKQKKCDIKKCLWSLTPALSVNVVTTQKIKTKFRPFIGRKEISSKKKGNLPYEFILFQFVCYKKFSLSFLRFH